MKSIGAKELRLHLDEVLDRVLAGEEIVVKHRFKDPVRLLALDVPINGLSLSGLQAFDLAEKRASGLDPNKSIKRLYRESLTEKYDQ